MTSARESRGHLGPLENLGNNSSSNYKFFLFSLWHFFYACVQLRGGWSGRLIATYKLSRSQWGTAGFLRAVYPTKRLPGCGLFLYEVLSSTGLLFYLLASSRYLQPFFITCFRVSLLLVTGYMFQFSCNPLTTNLACAGR